MNMTLGFWILQKMAQRKSLNIRLAMLREKYGVKQSEIENFTQTAVSKLENRKDMQISTLYRIFG